MNNAIYVAANRALDEALGYRGRERIRHRMIAKAYRRLAWAELTMVRRVRASKEA